MRGCIWLDRGFKLNYVKMPFALELIFTTACLRGNRLITVISQSDEIQIYYAS